MDSYVISLGGSVFNQENIEDILGEYSTIVNSLIEKHVMYFVIGGGMLARRYIEKASIFNPNKYFLDEIGIMATRINAMLFVASLKINNLKVSYSIEDACEFARDYNIAVVGGIMPGITTDGVSALLAEACNAKMVINATNVDAIYTDDPKINKNVKKISKMYLDDLITQVSKSESYPGRSGVFDLFGCKILQRSKIPLRVINGTIAKNVYSIIEENSDIGTVVIP